MEPETAGCERLHALLREPYCRSFITSSTSFSSSSSASDVLGSLLEVLCLHRNKAPHELTQSHILDNLQPLHDIVDIEQRQAASASPS